MKWASVFQKWTQMVDGVGFGGFESLTRKRQFGLGIFVQGKGTLSTTFGSRSGGHFAPKQGGHFCRNVQVSQIRLNP